MELTSREFLVSGLTAAGGMMISFHIPAKTKPFEPYSSQGGELNAWLTIEPDNTITIRVAQAEMGQGVFTSLPMIVADELEADWRNVRAEYADANRSLAEDGVYKRMLTGGSAAVRTSMPYLQQAGAEAREKMIKAAAEKWRVAIEWVVLAGAAPFVIHLHVEHPPLATGKGRDTAELICPRQQQEF